MHTIKFSGFCYLFWREESYMLAILFDCYSHFCKHYLSLMTYGFCTSQLLLPRFVQFQQMQDVNTIVNYEALGDIHNNNKVKIFPFNDCLKPHLLQVFHSPVADRQLPRQLQMVLSPWKFVVSLYLIDPGHLQIYVDLHFGLLAL